MNELMKKTERMTSIEIAEIVGKNHFDVLRAIRKMVPAWEKVCKCKFALTSISIPQPKGGTREVPCYSLTKTECLYIATKFNDEARARLVLRWEELEKGRTEPDEPVDEETRKRDLHLIEEGERAILQDFAAMHPECKETTSQLLRLELQLDFYQFVEQLQQCALTPKRAREFYDALHWSDSFQLVKRLLYQQKPRPEDFTFPYKP